MKQSELIALIERTAPLAIAAPWDRSGVQVASARQDINRLAVCLDPTPESIRIALSGGAEMILAHHPLTMEGGSPIGWTATAKSFRWCFGPMCRCIRRRPSMRRFGSGFLVGGRAGAAASFF
ncbi:MAG: Nif3-like dinuclear metal center hexameric protein [Bilophila wadsworthia]